MMMMMMKTVIKTKKWDENKTTHGMTTR